MSIGRDGAARNYQRPEGLVPKRGGSFTLPAELHGPEVRRSDILSISYIDRDDQRSVDVPRSDTNPYGEEIEMITLASFSGFLGTVWFMALLAVGGFVAGVVFKNQFLKLITGGSYRGGCSKEDCPNKGK